MIKTDKQFYIEAARKTARKQWWAQERHDWIRYGKLFFGTLIVIVIVSVLLEIQHDHLNKQLYGTDNPTDEQRAWAGYLSK